MFLVSFFGIVSFTKSYINSILVEKVLYTGNISEGTIGNITNGNPYFPNSQTDKDISKLLYSGLTKTNLENNPVLDLAEKIETNQENTEYTVTLRPEVKFHNNVKITTDDIVGNFEIFKALNETEAEHISIEKISDNQFKFILKEKDEEILEKLTFPILPNTSQINPTTIEEEISSTKLSETTIGSGPFKIEKIIKKDNDIIESIQFKRFDDKSPKAAYLQNLTVYFFGNEAEAVNSLEKGQISVLSGAHGKSIEDMETVSSTMNTNFVLFINQKGNENLKSKDFRKILSDGIDRESLVNSLFTSSAMPVSNILSTNTSSSTKENLSTKLEKTGFYFENGLLYKGTKKSKQESGSAKTTSETDTQNQKSATPIKLNLLTKNSEDMLRTAEFIKSEWQKIGIEINIKTVENNELASVLKEKDFDIFLFGFNVSDSKDYYSFFHSSQITYPKLNISGYANKKVDSYLEQLKKTNTKEEEATILEKLTLELDTDTPIIFLYKPLFTIYYNSSKAKISLPKNLTKKEDKYADVENWYVKSEKVFIFFKENKFIKNLEMYFY